MNLQDMVTVPEAARRLSISKVSVYRAIECGRLCVIQTPLGVLVPVEAVAEYDRTRRPVRVKGEKLAVPA